MFLLYLQTLKTLQDHEPKMIYSAAIIFITKTLFLMHLHNYIHPRFFMPRNFCIKFREFQSKSLACAKFKCTKSNCSCSNTLHSSSNAPVNNLGLSDTPAQSMGDLSDWKYLGARNCLSCCWNVTECQSDTIKSFAKTNETGSKILLASSKSDI